MLIIAKLEFSLLSLEHMLTKTNSNNQIMFSILEAEVNWPTLSLIFLEEEGG